MHKPVEFLEANWFCQELSSAELHGTYGCLDRRLAAKHYDFTFSVASLHFL